MKTTYKQRFRAICYRNQHDWMLVANEGRHSRHMAIISILEEISGLDYNEIMGDSMMSKVGWDNFFSPIISGLDEGQCEELYFRYMANR